MITLNEAQKLTIAQWAADDRLWTCGETVAFNLETFARAILRDQVQNTPVSPTIAAMTIRDAFAVHAMQSMLLLDSRPICGATNYRPNKVAQASFEMADAMMDWRNKNPHL